MCRNIALMASAMILFSGASWAQMPGPVVAPVTSPQTTGSTVQSTSDAAKTLTPPPAAATETKGDSKPAPKAN